MNYILLLIALILLCLFLHIEIKKHRKEIIRLDKSIELNEIKVQFWANELLDLERIKQLKGKVFEIALKEHEDRINKYLRSQEKREKLK